MDYSTTLKLKQVLGYHASEIVPRLSHPGFHELNFMKFFHPGLSSFLCANNNQVKIGLCLVKAVSP